MERVINIYSDDQRIDLQIGNYKIDIIGGWGVKLGQFEISFVHTQSGEVISCKKSFWSIQSFVLNKKAKRMFVFSIEDQGTYKVILNNQDTLEVKESNLFLSSMLQDPIPNDEVCIYINRCNKIK